MSPTRTLTAICAAAYIMAGVGSAEAQPEISIPVIDNIGAGLQSGGLFAVLGESEHGGIVVHVESSDSTVALVSGNVSTAGEPSVDIFLNDGITSALFYVHGLEDVVGTAVITVSAPGFVDGVDTVEVVTPALFIDQLVEFIDVADPENEFRIRIGTPTADSTAIEDLQNVRAGSPGLEVTVVSSSASTGRLRTIGHSSRVGRVTILEGKFISPISVDLGGIAFRGHAAGVTTVSATASGFITTTGAAQMVQVTNGWPLAVKPTKTRVALNQNFPNPFNPITTIEFVLAEREDVTLRIYDVGGRLVRELIRGSVDAGVTTVQWDGRNSIGAPAASGVYLYRLETSSESTTRRMTLLK